MQRAESSRDDSEPAALTARALAAEAETASLREQLTAAQRRADELAGELRILRGTEKPVGTGQRVKAPATVATSGPALPPQIKLSAPRRCEQIGAAAWTVHVGDVPIGDVRMLSGKYWPTLPNGFEVYLGGAGETLDEGADKLARGYNGWANYWHGETSAKLILLKPQRDGARTVKWGGLVIGKVHAAAAAGYGGEGTIAVPPKDATLGVRGQGPTRFDDEQQAAEALLDRWHADHPPPWGELVTTAR